MCLRAYQRFQDGKEHTSVALVDSERTLNGPRQRTVAYLGELHRTSWHAFLGYFPETD